MNVLIFYKNIGAVFYMQKYHPQYKDDIKLHVYWNNGVLFLYLFQVRQQLFDVRTKYERCVSY